MRSPLVFPRMSLVSWMNMVFSREVLGTDADRRRAGAGVSCRGRACLIRVYVCTLARPKKDAMSVVELSFHAAPRLAPRPFTGGLQPRIEFVAQQPPRRRLHLRERGERHARQFG